MTGDGRAATSTAVRRSAAYRSVTRSHYATHTARRGELPRNQGADAVLVLPFNEAMPRTPADVLAIDVLVEALSATDVGVGENLGTSHPEGQDPG